MKTRNVAGGLARVCAACTAFMASATFGAAEKATADALVHRWSFTGNVKDSMTGREAKSVGTARLSATALVLPGGRH